MAGKKSSSYKLLHVVTLVALLLSLVGVSVVSAGPAAPARSGGPVVTDDASTITPSRAPETTKIDPKQAVRVIIQLDDPSLASYAGGTAGMSATSPSATGSKLDVNSPSSRAYLTYLSAKQAAVKAQLAKAAPGSSVQYSYQVALNGMAAKTTMGQISAMRAIPGVKAVTVEREFKLEMDASIPLIGLGSGTVGGSDWTDSGLWAALGGHANAGAGMKIADIDSGIALENPCFDPTGYTYPASFPKYGEGYAAFVNPKVIAARAYFRADDPPTGPATPADSVELDFHGSHTAGTMACNYGTQTPWVDISGVAPKAQLMVYRVFYHSVTGQDGANDPELLLAIEDAIKDGPDVINNSWGGTATIGPDQDPLVIAYSSAVDAGIPVIFSAGNSGPGGNTVGEPGTGPKFITAAASTTNRVFTTTVGVTAVTPPITTIPVTVTNIVGVSDVTGPTTAPAVDLEVEGYADAIACNGPLPSALVSGKIVVVKRGTCVLVDKVSNAAAGGAVGVVIRNVPGGAATLPLQPYVLPTVHILVADGQNLKAFLTEVKAAGSTATMTIAGPAVPAYTDPADTLASFSSRGPAPDMSLKPDISAPGNNTLSAGGPGFELLSGTSMAAPHVTASAALLKQLHPDWTPAQIKSALMTTAAQPASLGKDPVNRGAGRLDLSHPQDPGLTFNMPSLGFGLVVAGQMYTKTVTATDVSGMGGTYTISAAADAGTAMVPVVPASVTVPANGSASFDVVITVAGAGEAYGNINLSDGNANHMLHLAYWAQRVADLGLADVLLIDDDNSADGCGPDYTSFYTQTLTNLGLSYTIWEVVPPSYNIDFNQARRYSKVLYFTGDAGTCSNLDYTGAQLQSYLSGGGKMVATGQDIAALNYGNGGIVNFALTFGEGVVQNSLYPGNPPVPSMTGDNVFSSYLMNTYYDISPNGDGAGNQTSVDEIRAALYPDMDALPILVSSPVTNTALWGQLGTRMSSEPTIERVKGAAWTHLGYRTEFLSFGLEGVNNNTGFNTREDLLDRLFGFLDDEVSLTITSPSMVTAAPWTPVTATVSAATSVVTTTTGFVNEIQYYRWDFGDGTSIQTTNKPMAPHGYAHSGIYNVYVEVGDSFGHKAVAKQVLTVNPPVPDLSASTKTVNKATAAPEEKLTYTLTIKNTGTATANDPWITDAIPAGTSYVAGSASGGAVFDEATKSIKWGGAGALPVGGSHTVSFQVTVLADTAIGTSIANTATFKDVTTGLSVDKTATTTVVAQAVLTPAVAADTYLYEWVPTGNYGNEGRMFVRAADVQEALMKFDLSALPAGAIIKKAELQLYAYAQTNPGPMKVGAFQVLRPWSETQTNWTKASSTSMWETPGAKGALDVAATPGSELELSNAGAWYTFDLKSIAQNWANGDANNGVMIKYTDGDVMVSYTFASSTYFYSNLRPVITIQYVNP